MILEELLFFILLKVKFYWLEFKVLGLFHLYGKAFQESQVLSGQIFIRKEEVARDYVKFLRSVKGRVPQSRQRRGSPSKKRELH